MSAWVKKQFSDNEHAQRAMLSLALGCSAIGVAMMLIGVALTR